MKKPLFVIIVVLAVFIGYAVYNETGKFPYFYTFIATIIIIYNYLDWIRKED